MDLIHFQTFLAIYRLGSQSQAAKQLCLTQPALCQHIKSLESQIGHALFIRNGKYLKPTAFAHQLALSIGNHVDALNQIRTTLKQKDFPAFGTVYLGGLAEFFATVIAPHLESLNQEGISLCFEIGHDTLLEKLLSNELDLAQLCAPVFHPGITIEKLFHEEFFLVGAPSFAKKFKSVDASTFNQLPWIAYDESLLFIKDYYQTVFEENFTGKVVLMVKDLWSIESAVLGGYGITVLPSYFCKKYLLTKQLVRLHKPKIHPNHFFYLAWKDGALNNPHVSKVRKLLHQAASEKSL